MNVYATVAELRTTLSIADGEPDPADATALLEHASMLVTREIRSARYPADVDGVPTHPDDLAAVNTATLRQAAAWVRAGVNPLNASPTAAPRRAKSKGLGGVTVTYERTEADAALDRLTRGQELEPSALLVLEAQQLLRIDVMVPRAPRRRG